MSFLAKLKIDGEEFNVMEFDIHFSQEIDTVDRPCDVTRGGSFRVVIESDRKTDFLGWMLSSSETKDGTVTFFRRDAMSKMKALKFTKGFCIDYRESFRHTTDIPMTIEMKITSKELDFSGTKFNKTWSIE